MQVGTNEQAPARPRGQQQAAYEQVIAPEESVIPAEQRAQIESLVIALTDDLNREAVDIYSDSLKQLAVAAEYIGFDPKKMRATIYFYAKGTGDATAAVKVIYCAIVFGLVRGNNVVRMKDTMKPEAKTILNSLTEKLKIESRANRGSSTITMSRLCICFPEATATIATIIEMKGVVADIDPAYPYCMRNGSFSALIPKSGNGAVETDVIEKLRKAHTYFQARVSMQLDRKVKMMSASLLDRQRTFVYTGMNSSLVANARRWAIINDPFYRVMVGGSLNPAIAALATEHDLIARSL